MNILKPNSRRRSRPGSLVVLTTVVFLAAIAAADAQDVSHRYADYCSVCHGDDGQGAAYAQQGMIPAPRNFTDPSFAATLDRDRMINVISNGKPGTAMIAWKSQFTGEEIAELADYIVANFAGPGTAPAAGQSTLVESAESLTIYRESCSVCHGDDGTGAVWGRESLSVPPRDFTSEASQTELTRDRMIASVTYGRPGSPMPGFGTQLKGEQIAGIVDFIRANFMSVESGVSAGAATPRQNDAANNPVASGAYHEMPFPAGLSGRFERGRAFYMANCVTCHGLNGAGDGPRAYFIFPRPRNFLDPATRQILNRPTLYRGIRDGVFGREMPAWGKVLSDQDIADIAEYVYREFIRTDTTLR